MGTTENREFNPIPLRSLSLDLPDDKKKLAKLQFLLEQAMEERIVQELGICRSNDYPYVVAVPSTSYIKNSFVVHTFWEGINNKSHYKKLNEIINEVFNSDFIKTMPLS